ncbi:Urb2/Npa2 family-domain-containing protein [Lipomyces oligophaga]|uniref:Urb2/Npa2 family-domain-containing protein n=1 Tax=Lipomyces oligophaga TaxID=45792 RepID=UPI0034CD9A00
MLSKINYNEISESEIPDSAFSCSENASRFLRSKSKDLSPALLFAANLLENRYPTLYFPKRLEFLLDWWFDRIEIGYSSPHFWIMFRSLWPSLDAHTRAQIFYRHKFLESFNSILSKFKLETNLDPSLLVQVFRALHLISLDHERIMLRFTVDILVPIISSYIQLAIQYHALTEDDCATGVFSLYDDSLYGVSSFKKISASFFASNFDSAFTLLLSLDTSSKLYQRLSDAVRDIVFSPSVIRINPDETPFAHLFNLLSRIPDINQHGQFLSHILILGLSKLERTHQEAQMSALVTSFLEFSPENSKLFLLDALNHNVQLPSSILCKALRSAENYQDWELAQLLLEIDPDAVFPSIEDILSTISSDSESSISFLYNMADSFAKVRDLLQFINIWRKASKSSEARVWSSEALLRQTASLLAQNVTTRELIRWISILVEDPNKSIQVPDLFPLTAIVIAISLKTDSVAIISISADRIKALYKSISSKELKSTFIAWKLKYYISSLSPETAMIAGESENFRKIIHKLVSSKGIQHPSLAFAQIQLLFRLSEFFPDLEEFASLEALIVDIFKTNQCDDWDGSWMNVTELNMPIALASTLIDRWIILLQHRFSSESLKSIINAFWKIEPRSQDLWVRLLGSEITFEQRNFMTLITQLLITNLESSIDASSVVLLDKRVKGTLKLSVPLVSRLLESLNALPLDRIERKSRERILDCLLTIDMNIQNLQLLIKIRSIVLKLLKVPNMSSRLQSEGESVISLFKTASKFPDFHLYKLTVSIVEHIFEYSIKLSTQSPTVLDLCFAVVMRSIDSSKIDQNVLILYGLALKYKTESVNDKIQQRVKKHLILQLNDDNCVIVLLALLSLQNIMKVSPKLPSQMKDKMLSLIPCSLKAALESESQHDALVLQTIFGILCQNGTCEMRESEIILPSLFCSLADISFKYSIDMEVISKLFKSSIQLWEQSVFTKLFEISFALTTQSRTSEDRKYVALFCIVVCTEYHDMTQLLERKMALLSANLVLSCRKITSSRLFIEICSMLDKIVQNKPAAISVFSFIQIMEFLILSTCQHGPLFSDEYSPDEVYVAICTLTSNVFFYLKRYFRNRHNLLFQLLFNLIYPLGQERAKFVSKGHSTTKRPRWLEWDRACGLRSANAFSRLLFNICNSASSDRKRKRQLTNLSSVSGSARRALSKHTPFLILEFCNASMTFNFKPEVKKSIIEGIYTVFDTMGKRELDIANSASDRATRELFKQVYGDYKKFGKWQEL